MGAIDALATFLKFGDFYGDDVKASIAKTAVAYLISASNKRCASLVAADVLDAIVQLAKCGNNRCKLWATDIFMHLACADHDTCDAVVAAGALEPLVQQLLNPDMGVSPGEDVPMQRAKAAFSITFLAGDGKEEHGDDHVHATTDIASSFARIRREPSAERTKARRDAVILALAPVISGLRVGDGDAMAATDALAKCPDMSQILVDIGVLDLLVLRLAANPTIRHTHAESAIAHLAKHGGLCGAARRREVWMQVELPKREWLRRRGRVVRGSTKPLREIRLLKENKKE